MNKNNIQNTLILLVIAVVIEAVFFTLQYFGIMPEYITRIFTLACLYAIVSLSLNLITGFTGQLSLGQAGFMSIGAYATAVSFMKFSIPLPMAIVVGGLMAALFGFIIGGPTLRLKGDYLAITTLGFAEIIRVIMENLESLTGGAAGLKGIPSFFESDDFLLNAAVSFAWVFFFTVLAIVLVKNLINSSHGRAIISIREDEIAANSMGINVSYYKVFAFIVSAFIAGVGGGLYAIYIGYLNPSMFGFMNSVNFLVIVVLGGMGSITGTILASLGFTFLQEWLKIFGDMRLVIFALSLILVMLYWQKGLMGTNEISLVGITKKIYKKEITLKTIQESVQSKIASILAKFQGVK